MKLNLACSSIWGSSGYSRHSMELAKALAQEGVDLGIECQALPMGFREMTPDILKKSLDKDNRYETNVMINLPPYWSVKSGDRTKFHGFCVFEGDKLPPGWVKTMNKDFVTSVLVPSNHTKLACEASGINKPIHVIPHGVDTSIYHPNYTKVPVPPEDENKFNLLYLGGYKDGERDRKGLDIALRAFCAEFKPEEKVIFRAKINPAYCPPNQVDPRTGMCFHCKQNLESLKLPPIDQRPRVVLINGYFNDKELAQLYASHDALVAPSKAEAFNLPCLEAMACGTPVIATNYGGQTDYISTENGYLINVEKMEPATGETWLYEDVNWARPSQKHLQEIMRYCYEHQEEVKQKKTKALETANKYTWQNSAKALLKVLE